MVKEGLWSLMGMPERMDKEIRDYVLICAQ
jgi:hypothetical protein